MTSSARSKLSTREEARKAVEAAYNAFKDWKHTPAPTRGRIVARSARLLEENKEELAQILTREEGKTLAESRGELQRSINVAEFCAGESRRMNGETIQSELPANFAYTIKEPHGVVACITPWNFPVAIPVWKIAPALVAGNTVVFKPAEATPATAVRICEIFDEAGIAERRFEFNFGHRLGNRRRDRQSSGGEGDFLHRLERSRHSIIRTGGAARRESPMRNGRQKSGRRSGRLPIWIWRSNRRRRARSARPDNAARRRPAPSWSIISPTNLSRRSSNARRRMRIGDGTDAEHGNGTERGRKTIQDGSEIHRHRARRRRGNALRRAARDRRRTGKRLFCRADGFRSRNARHAHRAGRNFRSGAVGSAREGF